MSTSGFTLTACGIVLSVLLLKSFVVPQCLNHVNQDLLDNFTNTQSITEELNTELFGVIGAVNYSNNVWRTWDIYAPDSTPTGSKDYTFVFNVTMMNLESAASNEMGKSRRCVDYVRLHEYMLCGNLTNGDHKVIIIPHQRFVRVDFYSDADNTGYGFIACYEWREKI